VRSSSRTARGVLRRAGPLPPFAQPASRAYGRGGPPATLSVHRARSHDRVRDARRRDAEPGPLCEITDGVAVVRTWPRRHARPHRGRRRRLTCVLGAKARRCYHTYDGTRSDAGASNHAHASRYGVGPRARATARSRRPLVPRVRYAKAPAAVIRAIRRGRARLERQNGVLRARRRPRGLLGRGS